MKKTLRLIDLDCAHCAAKIEDAVKKLDMVNDAQVSFLTQKMILEADEAKMEEAVAQAVKIVKKIEPDVTVKS